MNPRPGSTDRLLVAGSGPAGAIDKAAAALGATVLRIDDFDALGPDICGGRCIAVLCPPEGEPATPLMDSLRNNPALIGIPALLLVSPGCEPRADLLDTHRSDWAYRESGAVELTARCATLTARTLAAPDSDSGSDSGPTRSFQLWMYETLLDRMPDMVGVVGEDGRHLYVNRYGRELLAFPPGTDCRDILPTSLHPPAALDHLSEVAFPEMRQTGSWTGETEMLTVDGRVIPVLQSFFTLLEDGDRQVLTATVARDLSERELLVSQLTEMEREGDLLRRRFEAIQSSSPDYVGVIDLDGSQLYLNSAGRRMVGYDDDLDLAGRPYWEIHPPDSARFVQNEALPVALEEGHWSGETTLRNLHTGDEIPVWLMLVAVHTEGGDPAVVGTIMRDLRVLRDLQSQVGEAERERRRAEEERSRAEASQVAKGRFLANISHEIRTPLNAVLGYAQLLALDDLTSEQASAVHSIRRAGSHLLALVNDVLDLSRLEAGAVPVNLQPTDMRHLLTGLSEMFEPVCEQKGLRWEFDDRLPAAHIVSVDRQRITQVIANLLDNSVKFTDAGAVRLTAAVESDGGTRLEVSDTGPGMSPEELAEVFTPFQQGSAGRRQGGTGLGLSIVRNLIEMMGGTLRMSSQPGKGLRIVIRLPLVSSTEPVGGDAMEGELADLDGRSPHALVVDDNEDNRAVLSGLLRRLGLEVEEARDGLLALAAIEHLNPEFVFVDIRMPGMDGDEMLAVARRRWPERSTRYVAVTATGLTSNREDYRARGFDDFVRKPFQFSEISLLLSSDPELGDSEGEPPAQGATTADTPRGVTLGDPDHLDADLRSRLRELARSGRVDPLQKAIAAAVKASTDTGDAEATAVLTRVKGFVEIYDLAAVEALLGD